MKFTYMYFSMKYRYYFIYYMYLLKVSKLSCYITTLIGSEKQLTACKK